MFIKNSVKKILISLLVISMMLSCTVIYADVDNVSQNIHGALLGDLDSGEILYDYNIDKPFALASISKLMTYTVLMDNIRAGKISIGDEMTVSYNALNTPYSSFFEKEGEKLKVSTMIDALLIVSGNDVATAIAENVSGSVESFVEQMNKKAKEIGLESAVFINPHGLPEENKKPTENYMSIRDLYKFVRYVLTNYPEILETTKKQELVIPERNYSKKSTNPLFGEVEGIDGLKTGYTDEAGICLIATLPVSRKDTSTSDYRLISIVLGAQTHPDRIEKSKALIEYGRNNFVNKIVSQKEIELDKIYVSNAKDTDVSVYPSEDYNKLLKSGESIKMEIVYNDEIKAPLKENQKIGELKIYKSNELIKTIDVQVNENVEKANIFVRIFRFFKNLFS